MGTIGAMIFRCNICGEEGECQVADLGREIPSCRTCRSTSRWRAIVHVLSTELFGTSLALPDFPLRRDLRGIGLSDWGGYSTRLAEKFDYQNTYYHTEPRLDISSIDPAFEGSYDFVIASDVFEHVAPPVSRAFENLRRLLKSDGVAVFTVPYGKGHKTIEHFPELHRYEVVEVGDGHVLRNITESGVRQTFDSLTFHGGPGQTLEMRQFSESGLVQECKRAGLGNVTIYPARKFEYGIYWQEDWSLPMSLRIA